MPVSAGGMVIPCVMIIQSVTLYAERDPCLINFKIGYFSGCAYAPDAVMPWIRAMAERVRTEGAIR